MTRISGRSSASASFMFTAISRLTAISRSFVSESVRSRRRRRRAQRLSCTTWRYRPRQCPWGCEKLKAHGLAKGSYDTKIVVEKPFGEDRKSARELNRILTDAFDDSQIYRIDHYLAKEPVENIIFFRFSNTVFEDVWNRRYVDNVQITVAEDIGIEHRGAFYEKAGVVRDIVQNHMLQLLSLMAMEAPIGFTPDFMRDEK